MSGTALRLSSVIVILMGTVLLTVSQMWPGPASESAQGLLWLIPVAYFTMLTGAAGLAWGWFLKNRD